MNRLILTLLLSGAAVAILAGGCGSVVDADAAKLLHERLGSTSLTVFPAYIRTGNDRSYSAEAARQLADFFEQRNLATVTVSTDEIPIQGPWGMDESKMFRQSIADLQAYLREHQPQTDYVLLAEYLFLAGGQQKVGGVHWYLLDREGRVACAGGANSHHAVFREVDPKTVDDCTQIVLKSLAADLGNKETPK